MEGGQSGRARTITRTAMCTKSTRDNDRKSNCSGICVLSVCDACYVSILDAHNLFTIDKAYAVCDRAGDSVSSVF